MSSIGSVANGHRAELLHSDIPQRYERTSLDQLD